MDNYDVVLRDMITRLARLNYAIVADRTGSLFDVEDESLEILFFGQRYLVSKTDCRHFAEADEDNVKDSILIIDYLLSFGGLEAGEEWIDFRDLPGALPYDGAFRANVEFRLEMFASEIIKQRGSLTEKYAGRMLRGFDSYDFSIAFRVFPRLECLVLLCEGDDELPAGAKVLFTSNSRYFMTTESLAAIAESLTRRLVGSILY